MTEEDQEKKDSGRGKSVFESVPSYLAGFAAVATASVAVLTYLHNRAVAPTKEQETTSSTEPEIKGAHVTAVPAVEVAPTRPANGSTQAGPAASASGRGANQAAPSLNSALHPTQCGGYLGTWTLSTGEVMSLFENQRVEVKGGANQPPRFGRWYCSGRNEELFYLTLDREQTVTFDASGDGKTIYQRADRRTATPLSATRTSP